MSSLTPEQTDTLARWWRPVLEEIKTEMIVKRLVGTCGWADLHAKLRIIDRYELAARYGYADEQDTLGWVMRNLAWPYAAGRDGWVTAWRVQ